MSNRVTSKDLKTFALGFCIAMAPTRLAAADVRTIEPSPGRSVFAYDHASVHDRAIDGRSQREAIVSSDNSRDWQPNPNKQWRSENLLVLHCDANEYRIGWVRRYARNGKLLSDTPGSNQFYRALPGSFEMTIVRTICSAQ